MQKKIVLIMLWGTCWVYAGQGTITGNFTRDEARRIIEAMGGRVTTLVSKKTDYLILGQEPGSKYAKAQDLGIKILNESEFKSLIESK